MDAGNHLEVFLVSAVAAILAIRGYLHFTGYPQLGDDDLHIAHVLWGGLLMLASIIILLTFLSKAAENLAVIIGGIGFGTFIDEVGKFVTQDNDYFFKPSVAIIYTIFIMVFLGVRAVQTRRQYSQTEYLMNAIRDLEEVALHDLDSDEKRRVLSYLSKSDPNNPLVSELRDVLERAQLVPKPRPNIFMRIKGWLQSRYRKMSSMRWFHSGLIIFFLFQLTGSFIYVVSLAISNEHETLSWVEWARLLSSSVSAVFVLLGVLTLRRSRITAFTMFERSILVSIFFTQIFVFYEERFGALVGLTIDLLILIALRFMIERERSTLIKQQ